MEVVFGGGLWPLGQTVGFVELELAEAIEAYRTWTRGWWPPRPSVKRLPEAGLIDQLRHLLPLEMPYTRRLLVAHGRRWTAIFDNSRGGGDPYPAVAEVVARIARARGVLAGHAGAVSISGHAVPSARKAGRVCTSDRLRSVRQRSLVVRGARAGAAVRGSRGPAARRPSASGSRDRCCFATCPHWEIDADTASDYGTAVLIQQRLVRVAWRATLDEARAEALSP